MQFSPLEVCSVISLPCLAGSGLGAGTSWHRCGTDVPEFALECELSELER